MELVKVEQQEYRVTEKDLTDYLFGTDAKLDEKQKRTFFSIAMAYNLNPFKREIYAIKYGNNFNIITGYETYLRRAERTGLLEWWEAGVKKDGNELIGWCSIKRKDRTKETTIEAWYSEYKQDTAIWRSKPKTMLRKVAIAQAFRMMFPEELAGIPYDSVELGVEGQIINAQPVEDKEFPELSLVPSRVKELIDSLNAAGKLGNAEKFLGKKSSEWTDADVDKVENAKKKKSEPVPSPELAPGNPMTDDQFDKLEGLIKAKTLTWDELGIDPTKLSQAEASALIEDMAAQ